MKWQKRLYSKYLLQSVNYAYTYIRIDLIKTLTPSYTSDTQLSVIIIIYYRTLIVSQMSVYYLTHYTSV